MIQIFACGDVGAKRADCAGIFAGSAATLRQADLCLAQLETTITEGGAKAPNARLAMRSPPQMARAARDAGIDVMSFAGNHCMDFGYEAFEDTLRHCAAAGLVLCGAGQSLGEARKPQILEVNGTKVAVFAASSILPEGYAAEADKPGCAPLRAFTLYDQIEIDQPGTPPRIRSFAHREDLQALVQGIREARSVADVVLVSLHWGIHMIYATIADYQREVAHACIDAGADAILGHHPHLLKGVEIYHGRPVFYSLGNFAIEQPHVWDPAITSSASFRHLVSLNPQWQADAVYMLPENTRMSGIAKLLISEQGVETRFIPAWITDDSVPHVIGASDPHFEMTREFLAASSRDAGLTTGFDTDGDEILITAG
jgi:poly-gamma-glutamate capsule biosynthesis protein CapA/YwtB (metallophosphatase superfamily)